MKMLIILLKDFAKAHFIASQLAKRDIKARYKKSIFGVAWDFILPLGTSAIWILLNKSGQINLTSSDIPYSVFVLIGTFFWSIITTSVMAPLSGTRSSMSLIQKINFPHESILYAAFYKVLFDSIIKIFVMFILIYFLTGMMNLNIILLLIFIIPFSLVGFTIGIFLTPFGVLLDDVQKIISVFFQFAFFVTPVVYDMPTGGLLSDIMSSNPFTYLFLSLRTLLKPQGEIDLFLIFVCLIYAAITLPLAIIFYKKSIPIIIERVR